MRKEKKYLNHRPTESHVCRIYPHFLFLIDSTMSVQIHHPRHGLLCLHRRSPPPPPRDSDVTASRASESARQLFDDTGICVRSSLHRLRRVSSNAFFLAVEDSDFPKSGQPFVQDGASGLGLLLGSDFVSWSFTRSIICEVNKCNVTSNQHNTSYQGTHVTRHPRRHVIRGVQKTTSVRANNVVRTISAITVPTETHSFSWPSSSGHFSFDESGTMVGDTIICKCFQ